MKIPEVVAGEGGCAHCHREIAGERLRAQDGREFCGPACLMAHTFATREAVVANRAG